MFPNSVPNHKYHIYLDNNLQYYSLCVSQLPTQPQISHIFRQQPTILLPVCFPTPYPTTNITYIQTATCNTTPCVFPNSLPNHKYHIYLDSNLQYYSLCVSQLLTQPQISHIFRQHPAILLPVCFPTPYQTTNITYI